MNVFFPDQKAIEKMQKEFEEEKARGTTGICSKERLDVEIMALDLASLNSVENFIETFKSKETKLHLLLCNAGIAMHPQGMSILYIFACSCDIKSSILKYQTSIE